MKIRKLLRILHRDLGYFIVGMTVVYALSGIFLNHRHDFNPDYKIITEDFRFTVQQNDSYSADDIRNILADLPYEITYKKHYINNDGVIKVFIESGEAILDPDTHEGRFQYLQRRPLIFEMNKLHRATLGTTWKWGSDIMAGILLFVAVSGLFLLKGKRSFTRWGWWLTIAGFIVPLIFAILYI
ncbi:MAG: PepSY-associated TM helix domain-containing protein [Draconibacterium sp.]